MELFRDIRSPRWLYAKGLLFFTLALLSATALVLYAADLKVAVLLVICVWASCRTYYFAFYVIEHYIEPGYRYAGLVDFARRAVTSRVAEADRDPKQAGGAEHE